MSTPIPVAPAVEQLLGVSGVTKRYGSGTLALRGVELSVRPGSVHGLVGANGAGKSTLVKIMCGVEAPTSGSLSWRGNPVHWKNPGEALVTGVAVVHQHAPLVHTLSVVENVFLRPGGLTAWGRDDRRAEFDALTSRIDYSIDPDAAVGELSVGDRQMVAVLQALARDAALVLLDEPTASLSSNERDILFSAVRTLVQREGTSFVFVSHFLDEVLEQTDAVTVLRDGQVVADGPTAELDHDALVRAIVGTKLARVEAATRAAPRAPEPLLEVRDLESDRFGPVSFTVGRGEIVGLAGLLGSGRTEVLEAVYGADRHASGEVRLNGKPVGRSPRAAVRAGMALVPEDRTRQGLLPDWEIWRNISLPDLRALAGRPVLDVPAERARAEQAVRDLGIVAASIDTPVKELSGGNAQKVVFAKWIYGGSTLFLLDDPTVGVDVGAKADLLGLVRELAGRGHGVLIVTSDLEELLSVADRVLVLHRGRLATERAAADLDVDTLTALAGGLS